MFATALAFAAAWLAVPYIFYGLILALFVIASIGMTYTDEYDSGLGFWATVSSVGMIALFCNHFGVTWSGLREDWPLALGAVAAYFGVGVVWSFIKWYFHLSNVRELFTTARAAFMERNKVTDLAKLSMAPTRPAEPEVPSDATRAEENLIMEEYHKAKDAFLREAKVIEDFANHIDGKLRTYKTLSAREAVADPATIVDAIKPQASKHKAAICEWIAFWPVSFTWTMINDPVRKVVNYIFSRIKGTFQKMSDSMFAGV